MAAAVTTLVMSEKLQRGWGLMKKQRHVRVGNHMMLLGGNGQTHHWMAHIPGYPYYYSDDSKQEGTRPMLTTNSFFTVLILARGLHRLLAPVACK